ncbi:MAG: DMT family transporter [Clostridia bacterium]|nr:DMT family transporter [Clostridia bacterium]
MNVRAFVKYLVSMLLFGMNGVVASHIPLNSYEIVFFRTFIGSLFMLLMFLPGKGRFHVKEHKKDALFIALSGVSMGLSWMFMYEGFQQIGVSVTTLLYYCGPVLVMLLSPVVFRERLTVSTVVGFVVVAVGIVLVNGASAGEGMNAFGIFCGLMSAVGYCLMVTLNKKAEKITGMENTVIQLVVSCFTVSIFLGIKQGFAMEIPPSAWPWILVLGVVTTGYGCYLYFSSLSALPVQTAAVWGYLEALSAVVFAALFLGEKMTAVQLIGAVCIIGGAMASELIKKKKA